MSNIVQIRVCRREESVNRTRRVAVLKQQSPTDLERAVPDVLFLRQVFVELLYLLPVELDCLFRAVHPLEIGEKLLDVSHRITTPSFGRFHRIRCSPSICCLVSGMASPFSNSFQNICFVLTPFHLDGNVIKFASIYLSPLPMEHRVAIKKQPHFRRFTEWYTFP